ncbi:DUF7266 family protein [Natronosalvus caseinilyticus]|uniref:DUF7266 family protein n=1 Tax=Natronosalvus caseinilyticus TaxID=2953747 RepID=UPI0028A7537C|nr:hypothetical protein [Natronosalvus caseinilyticus]
MIGPESNDRGVSIAITHVLTLGITTVLVAGLLISAGTLLESQTDRSAQQSLETIGERLSGEISAVDRMAAGNGTTNLTVDHPSMVASNRYTVTLLDNETCADQPLLTNATNCMRLSAQSADIDVYVPVTAPVNDGSSVSGGTIRIVHDGDKVTLERDR